MWLVSAESQRDGDTHSLSRKSALLHCSLHTVEGRSVSTNIRKYRMKISLLLLKTESGVQQVTLYLYPQGFKVIVLLFLSPDPACIPCRLDPVFC